MSSAIAKNEAYKDRTFYNLQYAGEIGFLSLGVGVYPTKRYTLGFMYGYVPPETAKGPGVQTIVLRQTYKLGNFYNIDFYTGLNLYHVMGAEFKTSQMKDAPRSYYPIGSIRGLLNLGTEVAFKHNKNLFLYFESGINDIWLVNYYNNPKTVSFLEHLSLGLGFKHRF